MNAADYMQWYYLIYWVPGGAALLLLLLSTLGGGHHSRMGAGHGPHALAGHHGHGGLHAGGHHAGPARPAAPASALFGFGRLPVPLVWGSLLLGWGVFGFWTTRLLEPVLRVPVLFTLPALGLAVAGGLGAARLATGLWTRLLPPEGTFVTGTVDLCGMTGRVVYPVDEARGRVHVYDAFGTLHDLSARVAPGHDAVPSGRTVLITDYNAERGYVVVEEMP